MFASFLISLNDNFFLLNQLSFLIYVPLSLFFTSEYFFFSFYSSFFIIPFFSLNTYLYFFFLATEAFSYSVDSIFDVSGIIFYTFFFFIIFIIFIILALIITVSIASLTLVERRVLSLVQRRVGPNHVGFRGRLQFIADALKLLLKGVTIPDLTNRKLFVFVPALSLFICYTFWLNTI